MIRKFYFLKFFFENRIELISSFSAGSSRYNFFVSYNRNKRNGDSINLCHHLPPLVELRISRISAIEYSAPLILSTAPFSVKRTPSITPALKVSIVKTSPFIFFASTSNVYLPLGNLSPLLSVQSQESLLLPTAFGIFSI